MPRCVIRFLIGAAFFLATYWLLLFTVQRAIVFPAPSMTAVPPPPADAKPIWLHSPAGQTEAWFLPPLTPLAQPGPLLIFAHGNAELIDYWPTAFTEPRPWGLAVLLVEYPGYGRSEGTPSRLSIQQTFEVAFDWARTQPSLDAARIIAYGRSLGGGAVADLSRTRPLAALILESSFTTSAALAARFFAPPFLVRDRFDNLKAIRRFRGPTLILHGDHDEIIPPSHGQRLAEAAGSVLQLMPCGHNDCPRPWPQLQAFLHDNRLLPSLFVDHS